MSRPGIPAAVGPRGPRGASRRAQLLVVGCLVATGGPVAIWGINHFRQAIEFLRRIVRESPGYGRIEDVEYSIPLCLWRLRGAWPNSGKDRLDRAISDGFQAFADRHPGSTMADEALYLAGIHAWLASGKRDDRALKANAARIAKEYPDGNVAREYAKTLSWIEKTAAPPPAYGERSDGG